METDLVTIGVVSDTHGLLRPEAVAVLQRADFVIHAGDVGKPEILVELGKIAPLTVVRGNIDSGPWARDLLHSNVLQVGDTFIYVIHNLGQLDIKPEAAGFSVVVYGHSHVPKQERKNGVLYFNPGSVGPRRFNLPISLGWIIMENGGLRAETVEL